MIGIEKRYVLASKSDFAIDCGTNIYISTNRKIGNVNDMVQNDGAWVMRKPITD